MFDELLNKANDSLILNGGTQIKVKPEFDECLSRKNDCVLKSYLWDVPGFRRWRITRMDAGEKLQVLNSVAYPNYVDDKPILGIDIIWFGVKGKLVAVLDFQPLIQNEKYFLKYFQGLKDLSNRYKEFNNQENMHIYDSTYYFSPWVLFYSGNGSNLSQPITNILDEFLQKYWEIDSNNDLEYIKISPIEVKKLQIEYDIYSAEKDPAHGLFKSYFGEEWADDFMHNFLFPESD
ncbi:MULTISPECIES: 15,16-dihydrobiliverdin:ferredoxin oxidoreductase [unclassified Prochlorococcus]|uniref:15,16-dihydrobiliverdin:ferredoxin oxidoreductase n=1 Tax=unclassified Prochlorococcus TaxID=2627481 RepID=UPI0005682AA4|nr:MULTISPECIES: 15,16-dihydrobiliverdin:ferredoxin oxidoreductase [unclassified Prochlorococcus]